MEQPNLAMIPSGVKATKLYSIMPEDGVGDFTFDRNLNTATRVNKDGLIEMVAEDVPRLNYDLVNGVPSECPSLLLEPQSTNLVTYSEDFSQSYWTKSDTSINVNQSTSPDGNINADSIVSSATNGVHYLRHSYVAVSANTPFTYSFFIKANGYTRFGVRDNAQTGAYLTYNLETESIINSSSMTIVVNKLKNNWFKCSFTSTIGSNGVAGYALYLLDDGYGTPPNAGDPNSYTYTGDAIKGFYIYGFQLEQRSYPTSYIPTSGSTVTRSAETCTGAGNASTFNSEQGILFAEIAALADSIINRRITLSDGTASNRIYISYKNYTNQIRVEVISSSSSVFDATISVSDITNYSKIAFLYKENDFKLYINGVLVASDTSGSTPIGLSVLKFEDGSGGSDFYGKCKDLRYYDTEGMTDTEINNLLTQLTQ